MDRIEEIVKKTADLARLELTSDEVAMFSKQLSGILSYIEKLKSVDTTGVDPLVTPLVDENGNLLTTTYLRSDELLPESSRIAAATVVETSADHIYNNFKVPQVIAQK
ncbi:MAG TPA: Asp-tRNA(Asn)/Glu-tRNA(Gln) amidotransferase subunit GatC [Oligoflexia bacterium]|nr:Asp-tRNA(Asn)/Glu-tRNA(Gln) amidotransferase subunit GatC [Oligoflexia bacterium]